jgi:hypothetical protein
MADKVKIDENNAEAPMGDGKVKKPRLKKFNEQEEPMKVNLAQSEEPAAEEQAEEQPKEETQEEQPVVEEVVEETKEEEAVEESEQPVVEEITDEKVEEKVEEVQEAVEEAIEKAEETGQELPENIQKLMQFMDETGGDLEDYVRLNQDYSKLDSKDLLREYYKQTKPHLDADEIEFLMEDSFTYDEDVDDPKDIRRKKLAFKEQVADARAQLDRQKSKYYEEIKSGVKLTSDQQKAVDFFNRYNKEQTETEKVAQQQREAFTSKTNQLFNDKFKGFEYNIGDKRFRFNVKDATQVKENQSDINNFVSKFMDKKQQLTDPQGYHKSLFTAMNADVVANHFYQQGKADAIKDSIAKAKNITTEPRQGLGEVQAGGIKVRVLSGNDSDAFKFKLKK